MELQKVLLINLMALSSITYISDFLTAGKVSILFLLVMLHWHECVFCVSFCVY